MCNLYVVHVKPSGNEIRRLDRLTAPALATLIWAEWQTQKAARLRTALNQKLEAHYGRRSAGAGRSQDRIVHLADAAD